jgi:CDP-diacylglycerol--glycerol-3-phosphate 3-phosphatidyltransferase
VTRRRFGRAGALTLTVTRLLLGPAMVLIATFGGDGRLLGAGVIAATLSDIFDGVVARRFGVASAGLRRFDSMADTVFYVGAGAALWLRHADLLRMRWPLIVAFIVMQVGGHLFDVWKFGRDTSYHTWSGRAFGVALCVSCTLIFWTGRGGVWLTAALVVGLVAHVDAFVISVILPTWHHDVKTIRNALRLRRAARAGAELENVACTD